MYKTQCFRVNIFMSEKRYNAHLKLSCQCKHHIPGHVSRPINQHQLPFNRRSYVNLLSHCHQEFSSTSLSCHISLQKCNMCLSSGTLLKNGNANSVMPTVVLSKMSTKMSIIELSRIGQDLFDFSDLTWGHPLTHSSTHRYLQTKSNYINKFKLYYISHLTWPHPLTHPLIHTPTHSCGCLNKS